MNLNRLIKSNKNSQEVVLPTLSYQAGYLPRSSITYTCSDSHTSQVIKPLTDIAHINQVISALATTSGDTSQKISPPFLTCWDTCQGTSYPTIMCWDTSHEVSPPIITGWCTRQEISPLSLMCRKIIRFIVVSTRRFSVMSNQLILFLIWQRWISISIGLKLVCCLRI